MIVDSKYNKGCKKEWQAEGQKLWIVVDLSPGGPESVVLSLIYGPEGAKGKKYGTVVNFRPPLYTCVRSERKLPITY